MSNYAPNRMATLVRFLADLKEETLRDGKDGRAIGKCGYLAAAEYIDACVTTLLEQQTRIEDLKNRLNAEMDENREYHRLVGDLEDLTQKTEEDSAT